MFFSTFVSLDGSLPAQECWHKLDGGGEWYVWKNWSRIARFWKYLRGSQKSGRFQTYLESFGAVVMVLGLERLEDFGRFLAGFRDCNNFWKVAIWMECHLWMELFVVTFQKTYPIQSAHVAQMNWRLYRGQYQVPSWTADCMYFSVHPWRFAVSQVRYTTACWKRSSPFKKLVSRLLSNSEHHLFLEPYHPMFQPKIPPNFIGL